VPLKNTRSVSIGGIALEVNPAEMSFSNAQITTSTSLSQGEHIEIGPDGLWKGGLETFIRAADAETVIDQFNEWKTNGTAIQCIIPGFFNAMCYITELEITAREGDPDTYFKLSLCERSVLRTTRVSGITKASRSLPLSSGSYVVKSGDNLSKIAKQLTGDSSNWRAIYNANKDIIKNPNLIYPGQKLVIPS
jgi:nucleoid-associated protein YgaU